MILWKPLVYKGITYTLEHLYPFEFDVIQASKGEKPERRYSFNVAFSLHCFSRKINDSDDLELRYSDNREDRFFCFDRYELSKKLPGIVKDIGRRKCSHTGHGNFFIVEVLTEKGEKRNYEIYFKVTKSTSGKLNLYIESAYIRDGEYQRKRRKKPIAFYVIAYNKLHNRPIKVPK